VRTIRPASGECYLGRGRRPRALAALAVSLLLVAGGCGAADATATKGAPVVRVVTGLWPLAQAAEQIGQGNVRVVDVVPDGQDPRTYALPASAVATVHRAQLVLEADAAFQPSVARAARGGAARVLAVTGLVRSRSPYVWLDPYAMEAVARGIARALERIDPAARHTFSAGLQAFVAQLGALDEDYQSILGDCPRHAIVAVDGAFRALQPRYPVRVVPVAGAGVAPLQPSASTVAHEAGAIGRAGVRTVYNEPWEPTSALIPLQARTGVHIGQLDTLAGVPPGGFPRGVKSYYNAMESVLSTLSGALSCPNPDTNG